MTNIIVLDEGTLIDYTVPGIESALQIKFDIDLGKGALLTANVQDSLWQNAQLQGMQSFNKPVTEDLILSFLRY